MSEPFTCFQCGDGNTPLYCLNCAGDLLKKDYIQRDKVKELVEALEAIKESAEKDISKGDDTTARWLVARCNNALKTISP